MKSNRINNDNQDGDGEPLPHFSEEHSERLNDRSHFFHYLRRHVDGATANKIITEAYDAADSTSSTEGLSVIVALIETHTIIARTTLLTREQHAELLCVLWEKYQNYEPDRFDDLLHISPVLALLGQNIMESLDIAFVEGIDAFILER